MDNNLDVIRKVGSREVPRNMEMSKQKIFAVIIDGAATSGIIRACDDFGVRHLAATTFSSNEGAKVNLISL